MGIFPKSGTPPQFGKDPFVKRRKKYGLFSILGPFLVLCSIGQIQLWGGDKGVNRNGGNLQYFEIHTRHKDLTIILADELPKSAEAMFTGGEVIYTFGWHIATRNKLFIWRKQMCGQDWSVPDHSDGVLHIMWCLWIAKKLNTRGLNYFHKIPFFFTLIATKLQNS